MRVAVLTNMWPRSREECTGVFVKREVEALLRFDGVDVAVMHVPTTEGAWRYVTAWGSVHRWLARIQPQAVHFHYGLSQLLCPWWHGPSVVTFHGSDLTVAWQRRVSLGMLLACPNRAAILVHEGQRSVLPRPITRNRLVRVIPAGVDTALFRPLSQLESRRKLGIPAECLVLLFPASPHRKVKNYDLFRSVADRVRELSGRRMECLALNNVEPSFAPTYFGAADVVVLTSLSEGSPVVVKEALACHRPVVSTPVGDVLRYTGGKPPCAVAGSWDAQELANLVVRTLREAPFDWESVAVPTVAEEARQVSEVYHWLCRQRVGP